jgi:hypothetical protein
MAMASNAFAGISSAVLSMFSFGDAAPATPPVPAPVPPPEWFTAATATAAAAAAATATATATATPGAADVSATLLAPVQALVDATAVTAWIGEGYDATGKGHTHTRLRVTAVHRIENPREWRRHASALANARADYVERPGVRLNPFAVPMTAGAAAPLGIELDACVNEALLFHGTNPMAVRGIEAGGFEPRLARRGLFGSGVYFAENSTKADEYAEPGEDGSCSMFISRVILGAPFVALRPCKDLVRPPCLLGHAGACHHERHSTLVAPTQASHPDSVLQKYREFVSFDTLGAMPVYRITYVRE